MKRSVLSLIIAAALLHAPATRAAQLDKDACALLKTEQAQLEQGGMRGSMGKGPDWAKANLAQEKLEQIRRLIEVDEQLLFRCGGRPLVLLPSDPDPAARGEVEGKDGPKNPPASAKPLPTVKKPPATEKKPPNAENKAVPLTKAATPPSSSPTRKAPPPTTAPPAEAASPPVPAKEAVKMAPLATTVPSPQAAAGSSATKEAEDKKAAAIKEAKAKGKKKADDAFRPQAADWLSNPFADQAAKK